MVVLKLFTLDFHVEFAENSNQMFCSVMKIILVFQVGALKLVDTVGFFPVGFYELSDNSNSKNLMAWAACNKKTWLFQNCSNHFRVHNGT